MELLTGICLRNFTPGRYLHDFRVVAFDMDSTLINIECIDELAKVHGCGEQVSRITEAAMQGHISDYASSLRQRVACLAGLSVSSLQEVYENKLKLNPGVAEFLDICQSQRLVTILVSGGFTYFTERIQRLLGIDYVLSNELEIIDGALTGHLLNPSVCDGEAKKKMLMEVCHKHHISL
ncbi:MAG: phosphoserine phosphatase SerB, partial [Gammaproteobacteria bacterium]|nr:phosphoserine phosphatase SerB [Gammaproteobacteria bacterium]